MRNVELLPTRDCEVGYGLGCRGWVGGWVGRGVCVCVFKGGRGGYGSGLTRSKATFILQYAPGNIC